MIENFEPLLGPGRAAVLGGLMFGLFVGWPLASIALAGAVAIGCWHFHLLVAVAASLIVALEWDLAPYNCSWLRCSYSAGKHCQIYRS
jgi:hypothetical protein